MVEENKSIPNVGEYVNEKRSVSSEWQKVVNYLVATEDEISMSEEDLLRLVFIKDNVIQLLGYKLFEVASEDGIGDKPYLKYL